MPEVLPFDLLRQHQIPQNTTLLPHHSLGNFGSMVVHSGSAPLPPAMSGLGLQQGIMPHRVASDGPPAMQLQVQLSTLGQSSVHQHDP